FRVEFVEVMQNPQRLHATISSGSASRLSFQRIHNRVAGTFAQESVCRCAYPTVRMIEHGNKFSRVLRIEFVSGQFFRLLMLNAIKAGELVIAIRARSGIARAMR